MPVPAPLIERFRRMTLSLTPALTITPLTAPAARIEPKPAPPPPPSMVIALVMLTVPKPPGSSASISPPAAVLEIAPANVLQGAVRLQGLASSPTPDTQVRVACALAIELAPRVRTIRVRANTRKRALLMLDLLRRVLRGSNLWKKHWSVEA